MSKKKKILIITLSVIVVLLAVIGIVYTTATREFLQLLLNDEKYTEVTLAQNGKDIATLVNSLNKGEKAYAFDGTVSITMDKALLYNNEKAAVELSNYFKGLKFSGTVMSKNKTTDVKAGISDKDGVIFSAEAISNKDLTAFKVNELDTGWMKLEKTKSDGTTTTEKTTDKKDAEYKITISAEKQIQIGETTVKGEAISIKIDKENLDILLSNFSSLIPDEYASASNSFKSKITSITKTNDVEDIVLNLFVNKKNDIVAIELTLDGEKDIYLLSIFDKENDKAAIKMTSDLYSIESEITLSKTSFEAFEIPSEDEMSTFNASKLKTSFSKYFFGDFLKNHDELADIASIFTTSLITSVLRDTYSFSDSTLANVSDKVTKMFGEIFGGNK